MDRGSAVYPDYAHLLAGIWFGAAVETSLRRCSTGGYDRGIQPFRSSHCNVNHAFWFVFRRCFGYGGRCANRSAVDVDAGQDLLEDRPLVFLKSRLIKKINFEVIKSENPKQRN